MATEVFYCLQKFSESETSGVDRRWFSCTWRRDLLEAREDFRECIMKGIECDLRLVKVAVVGPLKKELIMEVLEFRPGKY